MRRSQARKTVARHAENPWHIVLGYFAWTCYNVIRTLTPSPPMAIIEPTESAAGKFAGLSITLSGFGKIELTKILHQNSDTAVYATSRPGLVLKTFDLECGKPDEVSYGPYLSYCTEVENFEDVQDIEELRCRVPAYYGSNLDMERKFAFIAMEYLQGENLLAWCQAAAESDYPEQWAGEFRAALFETLGIVRSFHEHGIVLIDFKPDNVIRLFDGAIKFVDLGAFFTPRHGRETERYIYSATPDYAELLIDSANVQTGLPLTQGSDIFSAGVAFFEMATGRSRLAIADECADQMLAQPAAYRFRDSQIKSTWHAYPHLEQLLPLVEDQLKDRSILFSEFWHLLKGYLAAQVPDWESLSETDRYDLLHSTGVAFIQDQLPDPLKWLAEPIACATTLRSFRLKSVFDLMELIGAPVSEEIADDVTHHNVLVQVARDMDLPVELSATLNMWEVKMNPQSGHWAIGTRVAAAHLRGIADVTFLKEVCRDENQQRFFQVVGDLEADEENGERLTLARLAHDSTAWVGA